MTKESARLQQTDWKKWGPYLSERQWGTVKEDYSAGGEAWDYFSHEQARSRAYRWGEDGILGISDDRQYQLDNMTREWYMHPNGQIPAYEWAFGDVNPPVHAWATWRVYKIEQKRTGRGDRTFLERVFQKLLLNFTWWVNRKDAEGSNIFEGGFLGLDNLGLDNIGVFDCSAPLPTGGYIEQSDGTSWMAMYSLNMLMLLGVLIKFDYKTVYLAILESEVIRYAEPLI